jgi:hypothetical protein
MNTCVFATVRRLNEHERIVTKKFLAILRGTFKTETLFDVTVE